MLWKWVTGEGAVESAWDQGRCHFRGKILSEKRLTQGKEEIGCF